MAWHGKRRQTQGAGKIAIMRAQVSYVVKFKPFTLCKMQVLANMRLQPSAEDRKARHTSTIHRHNEAGSALGSTVQ